MSFPVDGQYVISNSVRSLTGEKLAITFQGAGQPATVENFVSGNTFQIWQYEAQVITPLNDPNVQASWGDDVVTVSDSLGSVWTVKEDADGNGYTIQDGDLGAEWGVTTHLAGEKVAILGDTGPPTQRWVFETVPATQ